MFKNKGLLLALGWLVIVNTVGILAVNRFNLAPDNAYTWISIEKYDQHQSWNIVDIHSRWDSEWYLDIVRNGYEIKKDNTLSNLVFFPLYPLLLKLVAFFVGGNLVLAGWILSSVFLIFSCCLLFKLVEKFHKDSGPLQAVFLLLIFPTAFFLNAVYTESLFLFLSLAVFYFTFERRYLWVGIFGLLAALTRVTGVLLFLPVLMQLFLTEGKSINALKKSWPLFFMPLGTLSFFAYHWIKFGDPLLFFKIESAWGRSFSFNSDHVELISGASIANYSLDIFYSFFALLIVGYFLKLKKYPYAVYVASTILVAAATGTVMSMGRYILVLFPIYIVGASIKNEIAKYLWMVISTMLMALNTYLFVNWYWAG